MVSFLVTHWFIEKNYKSLNNIYIYMYIYIYHVIHKDYVNISYAIYWYTVYTYILAKENYMYYLM